MKTIIAAMLSIAMLMACGCEHGSAGLDIEPLVKYAQQFRPCTDDGDCRNLGKTPDHIRNILEKHEMTYAFKASVMLVLLKHYNYEYSTFHQGYEVRSGIFREHTAFVKAFMRITGEGGGDHMTARVAYDWVNRHPEYLEDELIAEEMRKVQKTERMIEEMQ